MTSYEPLAASDPFPGNSDDLRRYRDTLSRQAEVVSRLADCVRSVSDSTRDGWTGEAAATFRNMADSSRQRCESGSQSLHSVAEVVQRHADDLEHAQRAGRSLASEAESCQYRIAGLRQQLVNTPCTDPQWPAIQGELADAFGRYAHLRRSFADVVNDYDHAVRTARGALSSATPRVQFLGLPFDNPMYSTRMFGVPPKPAPAPKPAKPPAKAKSKSSNPAKPTASKPRAATKVTPTATPASAATATAKTPFTAAGAARSVAAHTIVVANQHTVVSKVAQTAATAQYQGRNFGGSAQAQVKAGVTATGTAGIDKNGATLGFSAGAVVEATASANGSFRSEYVNAEGEVHATVEAKATVDGTASIGPNGAVASLGAAAFVGGEIGASGHVDMAGVGVGGDAGITYGIGGTAKVDARITKEKVSISADLGVTVGLGGHATFQIDIQPAELGHSLANLLHL